MVQLYRFALYGRAGSGKTCILAALSLPHTVHPDGLTCDWVPDPPDAAGLDEERKTAYRRGQVALTEARLALSRGEKPAPTPLDEGLLCYRFVFSAAKPEPRRFHVELIDYSGELIDPHLTASELAGKLRRHLQDMDGLLVLGEAPRPGEEQARLYGEFERLRQAFAALGQDRTDVAERQAPVALLLNKWDRRHPADGRPHERDPEMDDFLAAEPEPAHRGLVHSLEAAVPPGSFRRFAVSAFGASRHETRRDAEGTEREVELPPKTRPLPSFGLEDGFVWLARKRDELELAGLEERATELSWGSRWPGLYLNALWPFSAWRLDRDARRVRRRFAPGTVGRDRAATVRGKALRVGGLRSFTALAGLVLVALLVELGYDGYRLRRSAVDLERSDRTAAQLAADEEWLEDYHHAPWFRHVLSRWLLLNSDGARERAERSRLKREDIAFARVEAEADPVARAGPAREYLQAHPAGRHADLAARYIQEGDTLQQARQNDAHLVRIANELASLRQAESVEFERLRRLNDDLQRVPFPTAETKDGYQRRKALGDEIGQAMVRQAGDQLARQVQRLIDADKVAEAGRLLAGLDPVPPTLLSTFRKRGMERIEAHHRRCLDRRDWRAARDAVKEVLADPGVVALWQKLHLDRMEAIRSEVDRGEDRDLYEELRKVRTRAALNRYLETAPLQVMRKEAERYRDYLDQREGPIKVTLWLKKIEWGSKVANGKNDLQVTLDGNTVIDRYVTSDDDTTSSDVDFCRLQPRRLSTTVKLSVKSVYLAPWYRKNAVNGEGSWEGPLEELDGRRVELTGKGTSYAYFTLEGLPKEPSLAAYRD